MQNKIKIQKWEESEVQFTELEWENIFELPLKVLQDLENVYQPIMSSTYILRALLHEGYTGNFA